MTAAVVRHPSAAQAEARARDREIEAHAAEMHDLAVERAKRIIDRPGTIGDAKLATACVWYMRLSKGEGGGGGHYLRADQHLTAIRLREAEARQAQRDAEEAEVKDAMRYRPELTAIALGVILACAAATAFHLLTH